MRKIYSVYYFFIIVFFFKANSQLVINEILAANASLGYETDFYNFADWIEIMNSSNSSVNLSSYYISDDRGNLKMWRMPSNTLSSKAFYVIYCDKENTGKHSNFGLGTGGETIYISDANGSIIDSVKYGKQYPNISFGRKPDNIDSWAYCTMPTPGESNAVSTAVKQSGKPKFSITGGRQNQSLQLALAGYQVRYTNDGSEPASNSTKYSGAINISSTTVVKAFNIEENLLPSEVWANTYFINEHAFTLPVVALSFTPGYFYDDVIGIHVRGANGTTGYCNDVANWHQPWERPAYFEYYDENGDQQISQSIGVKIAGGCTRGRDQKSISLYARSKYGNNDFDYSFFKEKTEINKFKSLLLRNSGNDQDQTLLRDAVIQALVNKSMDLDFQAYQPAIVYFNGEYRGIMNIREKTDEDYFIGNYNLNSDEVDFLERDMEIIRGSAQDYQAMVNFLNSNSLAGDDNYGFIADQLDLQEYINYMVLQVYIGNRDWPGNNIKYWKEKGSGKWRWIVFDTDYGFGFRINDGGATFESLHLATATGGPDHPNPPWSTLLFRKMLENEGFKKQFIATFNTHMYTSFSPEWINDVIDSLSLVIDYEITFNQEKYGRTKSDWLGFLNTLRSYGAARQAFMPAYVKSFFGLNEEEVNISIANDDISKGKVELNNALVQTYPVSINTYASLPFTVNAIPEKGYRFTSWKGAARVVDLSIVSVGDSWKYLDDAMGYPENWQNIAFDDSLWNSGNSQLGYGDGDETTLLSYGPDANNKTPAALFRKKVQIDDTTGIIDLKLGLNADDGAVVYLNGIEVLRNNMPGGDIGFNSYAAATIQNENTILYFDLDKNILLPGENIVACEVHQASPNSSDLSFELLMGCGIYQSETNGVIISGQHFSSDTSFNLALAPVFEPVDGVEGIYINEIAAVSGSYRDEKDEKSGFIEIVNPTEDEKVLYGCFLSDSKNNLFKYSIPEGTVIPAGGFLTFYADGESRESAKHTSFILDKDGEKLWLLQKKGSEIIMLDSVKFKVLAEDHSYGRYPDATGDWMHMVNQTPGAANDAEEFIIGIRPMLLTSQFRVYPNPAGLFFNIEFVADSGFIQNDIFLDIFDISGKTVFPELMVTGVMNTIDVSGLKNGIYFLQFRKNNQRLETRKIVVLH